MSSIAALSNHTLVKQLVKSSGLDDIYQKVMDHERLSFEDGLRLFENKELAVIGYMANIVRERLHGNRSYFVRNRQLNPTNVCEYSCMFCSFYRREGEDGGYTMTMDEIAQRVRNGISHGIQEIHITSGLHPQLPFSYYTDMLKTIKTEAPTLHIKGFTAVEIEYYAGHYKMTIREVLTKLIEAGLEAMPGGGAEIFADRVRRKICDQKSTVDGWIKVHEMAHELGLMTNATMLYGHIERYDERIDHLIRLRNLQDGSKARGCKGSFNTFIPLKYQHENNRLKKLPQVGAFEDLKVIAVSRLMLDNFPNIKAYWVVIGKNLAQVSLSYGANEIEGTILEETIMSMAGTDSKQGMTTGELVKLISDAGRQPIERDALYNVIREFSPEDIINSNRQVILPVMN
ncbi:MAG: aminofutalosine synthase MqnE [Bacteroidetes bacterium]|nr:aminofutalosine synthase MqnE [Bacteroidota bacterium]